MSQRVILASASAPRAQMLRNAGVAVEIVPSRVDEDEMKHSLRAEGASPQQMAETLAELKAIGVSTAHPDALVIGADQVLALGDEMLDKPATMGEARSHLQRLSGRAHSLVCGACMAENGRRIWSAMDQAELTVRPLGPVFIDFYLDAAGEAVLASVGAYQLEGLGAQLFSRIRGDFFTILGLPLLPVLAFLRDRGVLAD